VCEEQFYSLTYKICICWLYFTQSLCVHLTVLYFSRLIFFLYYSSQGVTVSLNATSGMFTSYELSENISDPSVEHESGYNQGEDEIGYDKSEAPEVYASEYSEEGHYEGNDPELTEDQIEYGEEPGEDDEVLDLEINEPLDEFPVSFFLLYLQR